MKMLKEKFKQIKKPEIFIKKIEKKILTEPFGLIPYDYLSVEEKNIMNDFFILLNESPKNLENTYKILRKKYL